MESTWHLGVVGRAVAHVFGVVFHDVTVDHARIVGLKSGIRVLIAALVVRLREVVVHGIADRAPLRSISASSALLEVLLVLGIKVLAPLVDKVIGLSTPRSAHRWVVAVEVPRGIVLIARMPSPVKARLTQGHHGSPEALAVPIGIIGTESMPTGSLGWILLVRRLAPLVVGDALTLLVVRAKVALLLVDVVGHRRQELWDVALVESHHIV